MVPDLKDMRKSLRLENSGFVGHCGNQLDETETS